MEFNKEQTIIGIRVLSDNVIWLWRKNNSAVVIDPALSQPVIEYLKTHNLYLKAILQTHHHHDHIGGTRELIKEWPKVKVIASAKEKDRIPFQNLSVKDGDKLKLLDEEVHVIEVIGHTRSHLAFYIHNKVPILFIGDTLFSAGCGRIFEGTYKQMYNSLKKIKSLPKNTTIYCAHEYTKSNLLWALDLEPENENIKNKLIEVEKKIALKELTIPFLLEEELIINLFLRADNLKRFSYLRANKDTWV
ncbi:Putative hydroxyacylglutathione hydrolase [Prochlorococcus marinus str. MIT 9515]|uniref:Hydroxyacylglutathione hydrolase n=1 Tax=Prochlorococcus marinus (strain MIT 9515) TaxID=167542 RepID=A2BVM1_PROM5|nr:hydroxyacylglutathione hydrolase [Prochlorococcus marinus]ABM71832.1 Putative hydroxyacylglutathione hydrolase [Prochlorococcus marinus str. MIT 9515]